MAAMFQILGPVRLFAHGHNVELGPAKVLGLLGILLLSPDEAVPIDHIADRLWDLSDEIDNGGKPSGGRQQAHDPRKTLQSYVSKLRAFLRKAAAPAEVLTEHGYYRLKVDPSIVDYHRFRKLASEGRTATQQGDFARAVRAFDAAIRLWQGRPLADIQSSWSTRNGETLVVQHLLPAHCGLLEAHLALGHHDEVLARVGPLLVTYETYEPLVALQMRALAAVDGPASVATCFRDFARKLRDVLGTRPSDWLVQQYRVLTEQMPAEPAGTVIRRTPQQLPRDTSHFVGRADIMRRLDTLLVTPDGRPAVVSLYGAPGVGKTAVATHWAHRCREHFPDGTLYANLNGYGPGAPTSPTAVLAVFLDALGISRNRMPRDVYERETLLRHELAGRRMLVVLDNARDSGHVRPLLAATSSCPVLITSCQKLPGPAYHDGAHSITVPTLLVDEAIALLQLRIGDDRVVNDLAAVHDLAALCSSLPLALLIAGEYVAARSDTPVPDLVQLLRRQNRLLDAGSHSDDDSAKLRAVFDWSTNDLPPDADRLFCLLGLNPSTHVSTPAAAALAGWSIERTERAFDVLIDGHLTHQQSMYIYWLHDLLHVYAEDRARVKVQPEERHEAVHRLVDWYLHTATNAVRQVSPHRRPVPPLALSTPVRPQTFADEQEALSWCIRERSQVLAVTRLAIQYGFHDQAWRLIVTFDDILNRFGDPRDTVEVHRAALDSARITAFRFGEACIHNNIGAITFLLGEYENAVHSYTQALAIVREIEDEAAESSCLFNIGTTLLERGMYPKAIEFYQQSLAIAERLDDKDVQARVYHRLGEVYHRWEQHEEAERFYQRSLAMRVQDNDIRNQAITLAKLGELCVEGDDPQRAIEYCERSLRISRDSYDHRKVAEALSIRGMAQYNLGAYDESLASAEEAAALCKATCFARGEAQALTILVRAQEALGEVTAADRNRAIALSLIEGSTDPTAVGIRTALNARGRPIHSVPGQRGKPRSRLVSRTKV